MKKIKLLHIQLLPMLSGVQNVMLYLLDNLPKDKYEIYVASLNGGPLVEEVKKRGYTHIELKYIRRNLSLLDIPAFFELYRLIKSHGFDIVHTHGAKPGFWGRIAARLAKVPKVIHTHHGVPYHQNQFFLARLLYMSAEFIASRFASRVVFMNKKEYDLSVKYHLVPKKKATIIYNGYPVKDVIIPPKKDNEKFIIGNVARFEKQKNHLNVIDIAIKVCLKRKDIDFVFVGSGSLYKSMLERIIKIKMQNRIHLVGWDKHPDKWYKKFDVFLMFTLWEGMPLAVMEAMNYYLPIVASDIPGNDELVSNENGFLFKLNEKKKLIDLLVKLPEMKEELKKKGEKSHKILKEKFNLAKFVKRYSELYND